MMLSSSCIIVSKLSLGDSLVARAICERGGAISSSSKLTSGFQCTVLFSELWFRSLLGFLRAEVCGDEDEEKLTSNGSQHWSSPSLNGDFVTSSLIGDSDTVVTVLEESSLSSSSDFQIYFKVNCTDGKYVLQCQGKYMKSRMEVATRSYFNGNYIPSSVHI